MAFSAAEPALFKTWESEFDQMHPNSFTVQKLNLINPVRRKYQLKVEDAPKTQAPAPEESPKAEATPTAAPKVARPMIRPKPKMN